MPLTFVYLRPAVLSDRVRMYSPIVDQQIVAQLFWRA